MMDVEIVQKLLIETSKTASISSKNLELSKNLLNLSSSLPTLIEYAKEANYEKIHANGYWSFVKICVKFCELIENHIENNDECQTDFILISRYLIRIADALIEVGRKTARETGDHYSRIFTDYPEFFRLPFDHQDEVVTILGKYSGFWLEPSKSKLYRSIGYATSWGSFMPTSVVRLLGTPSTHSLLNLRPLVNPSLELVYYASQIGNKALRVARCLFNNQAGILTKDVTIRSKNIYVISSSTEEVKIDQQRLSNSPIRCRLIKRTNSTGKIPVILHCHGGGYVMGSPDFDEFIFLRRWCEQLPDCAILSLDYELFVSSHVPLQQLLDTYFWLFQDEDAIQQLGFSPEKVILCGESAGACTVMSLALTLDNIHKHFKVDNAIMPSAIIVIQPLLDRPSTVCASRMITLVDTFLFVPICLAILEVASGLRSMKSNDERGLLKTWSTFIFSTSTAFKELFQGWFKVEPRPYLKSTEEFLAFVNKIRSKQKNDYVLPLVKCRTAEVKVPLYIITSEFCPLLDDAICLAKMWKGSVNIEVLEDLPHGFLSPSGPATTGVEEDVVVRKLRAALTENCNARN